jgi:hypothetical protein
MIIVNDDENQGDEENGETHFSFSRRQFPAHFLLGVRGFLIFNFKLIISLVYSSSGL